MFSKGESEMDIKRIEYDFTVCKVKDYSSVNLEDTYCKALDLMSDAGYHIN